MLSISQLPETDLPRNRNEAEMLLLLAKFCSFVCVSDKLVEECLNIYFHFEFEDFLKWLLNLIVFKLPKHKPLYSHRREPMFWDVIEANSSIT